MNEYWGIEVARWSNAYFREGEEHLVSSRPIYVERITNCHKESVALSCVHNHFHNNYYW